VINVTGETAHVIRKEVNELLLTFSYCIVSNTSLGLLFYLVILLFFTACGVL